MTDKIDDQNRNEISNWSSWQCYFRVSGLILIKNNKPACINCYRSKQIIDGWWLRKIPPAPIVRKEAGGILASGFTIHTIPLFPLTFKIVPNAGSQYSHSPIADFSL